MPNFDDVKKLFPMLVVRNRITQDGTIWNSMYCCVDSKYICIQNENVAKFNASVHKIYCKDKQLSEYWSLKKFTDEMFHFLCEFIQKGQEPQKEDVNGFYKKMMDDKQIDSSVAIPMRGVGFTKIGEVDFGSFTATKIPGSRILNNNKSIKIPKGDYLVVGNISFCDPEKAYETGLGRFEDFKRVIYFMLGYKDARIKVDIGRPLSSTKIMDKEYDGYLQLFLLNRHNTYGVRGFNNFYDKLMLDDEYFNNNENGNKKIWEILRLYYAKEGDELQKRLVRAIINVGKSISSSQSEEAVLHLAIGMESLITTNSKEMFLESIRARLSEYMAIIVGETYEERLRIAKFVKLLYDERSNIAHGKSFSLLPVEYHDVLEYTRRFIYNILTKPCFSSFQTIDDLRIYVDKVKFSYVQC